MIVRDKLYIGGAWVSPEDDAVHEVTDSNNAEVMGTVPRGTPADADRAVAAAVDAFPAWSDRPVEQRAELVTRLAHALADRTDDLAVTIAREVGTPLALAKSIQVGLAVGALSGAADAAATFPWEEELGSSLVLREPVGVVAAITPWNYPLYQIALKVVAVVTGCTVVLKPSEVAPLNAFALADAADEVGLPPGVLNVVTGPGTTVGEALVRDDRVDMVSFTGSTRAGRRVMELAAGSVKRVALELGGKSANVILDDADLDTAVRTGVAACYLNSGQTCSALTRMVVPRRRLADVEEKAVAAAARYVPASALEKGTRLGPLVSAEQRERVTGYIRKGIEEGAKLLVGGAEPPEVPGGGYFVQPTIFSEVTPDMVIAQDEIFGPVLCIIPFDTDDDAVRIANHSRYGLAGAVWAGDSARAEAVARRIRTGQVDVNGGAFNPTAPFGGYKQSGLGRERGPFGLEEFVEVKSLQR